MLMNPLGILFNYVTSVIGSLLSIGLFTLIVKLTWIPLKRLTVDKEAIYIAVGIRPDGAKEVLGYTIVQNESTITWKELLEDLVSRGVQSILLFVTDGLKDTIHKGFPSAYPHFYEHVSSNLASKLPVADRKDRCEALKAEAEFLEMFGGLEER